MKIATWNISGAHTINSKEEIGYSSENINYFAQNLKKVNPDIVFLQETHMPRDGSPSLARRFANELGFTFYFDTVRAEKSFIDATQRFGLSIISRWNLQNPKSRKQPDVSLSMKVKYEMRSLYPAFLQSANFSGINFFNTHFQPIQCTKESYWSSKVGANYARCIDKFLCDSLRTPMIFAGDFNAPNLKRDFPRFFSKFYLNDAVPREATDLGGEKMDYILYSPELKLLSSEIIKTDLTDHYLLVAEFADNIGEGNDKI
jgi:endonuclease/exonuclease/phosphatase family metal-dependent hydrolase